MRRNLLLHQNKRSTAVDKTVESGSRAIRIVWRESRNHSALVCRYHNTRLTGRPAIANQNKFYRSPPLQKCQVIVSVRLGRSFAVGPWPPPNGPRPRKPSHCCRSTVSRPEDDFLSDVLLTHFRRNRTRPRRALLSVIKLDPVIFVSRPLDEKRPTLSVVREVGRSGASRRQGERCFTSASNRTVIFINLVII